MSTIKLQGFQKKGSSRELVVILHAYAHSPKRLNAVRGIVTNELPDADIYIPNLPMDLFSIAKPTAIVQQLLTDIDKIYTNRQERSDTVIYEKIILIGHSLGALLARKLYVCACGEILEAPIEQEIKAEAPRPWAEKVERIILLAGMNGGWQISHHLSLLNAISWTIGTLCGNILWFLGRRQPLIFTIRKGASFITQLRIHWIHMRNSVKRKKIGDALTIQLLGSIDDMVSPEDNIDLISGHDFVYLDVPYSGHKNIIEMDDQSLLPNVDSVIPKNIATIGEARASVFREALLKNKDTLLQETIFPSDLSPEGRRHNVSDVVFVIHGIRDKGYWTHKVARRIILLARNKKIDNTVYATETSSYGYFPILSFFLPTKRREKVEWLMDQYAEALALYPNAEFSFVGHSNGTYLLASALQDYPVCRFKNVVLAGSVIKTGYDWEAVIARGQVKKVLNYVATADWVVAFFPRMIQKLRIQDLGGAGHDGFDSNPSIPQVEQFKFIRGTHSAALNEANWDAIAHFVLTGEQHDPPLSIKGNKHSWFTNHSNLVAPLIWIIIVGVVIFLPQLIWKSEVHDLQAWQQIFLSVLLAVIFWKIITKI